MTTKIPPRNAKAAYRRKVKAARRIGENRKCKCGESRPEALIPSSDPITCAACNRRTHKKSDADNHHIAGKANSPITIKLGVNDHRAEMNVSQQDWPRKTLENPDSSPLLSGAAHIRGFVDLIVYLVQQFLLWVADMLELLDTTLERKLGRKWWTHTKLRSFEPEA
jgi:hypothetical protein